VRGPVNVQFRIQKAITRLSPIQPCSGYLDLSFSGFLISRLVFIPQVYT